MKDFIDKHEDLIAAIVIGTVFIICLILFAHAGDIGRRL